MERVHFRRCRFPVRPTHLPLEQFFSGLASSRKMHQVRFACSTALVQFRHAPTAHETHPLGSPLSLCPLGSGLVLFLSRSGIAFPLERRIGSGSIPKRKEDPIRNVRTRIHRRGDTIRPGIRAMEAKLAMARRVRGPPATRATAQEDAWTSATRRAALLGMLASGGIAVRPSEGAGTGSESQVAAFKRLIAQGEKSRNGLQVPEFRSGLDWMNVSRPLQLEKDLRGRVVVLDFWTYCCINCMHILPDLAKLEEKYKDDPVTVVGVHSAKFDNEKDTEAIRQAVLRYGIQHPVVNDGSMTMWRELGVSSWPTLAIVSPQGKLLTLVPGEGNRQDVDDIVAAALEYYGERGLLRGTPLPIALEAEKPGQVLDSPFKYPGKLAIDAEGHRLFISDSSNHRIVVTNLDGQFVSQVGDGTPGFADGTISEAKFCRPQGIAYDPNRSALYVADTENHALRQVDFSTGQVVTLSGDGTKGRDYVGGKKGGNQQLNSPWDVNLLESGTILLVAMAGIHQIWTYNFADQVAVAFSGNGYERNSNGTNGKLSSWAQPSGIALSTDKKTAYIADSESSSIRELDVTTGGSKLLAGGDAFVSDNLFQFGDVDGDLKSVRLQHPLGICTAADPNLLYIADSYNHKIKVLDLSSRTVRTVAGSGSAGLVDGKGRGARFSEPAGIMLGPENLLYVADTNNNAVRVLDLVTGSVTTMDVSSVPKGRREREEEPQGEAVGAPPGAKVVRLSPVGSLSGELKVSVACPPGYHYTKGAKSQFEVVAEPTMQGFVASPQSGQLREGKESTIKYALKDLPGGGALVRINAKVYYCQEGDVCLFDLVSFEVPIASDATGSASAPMELQYAVHPRGQRSTSAILF